MWFISLSLYIFSVWMYVLKYQPPMLHFSTAAAAAVVVLLPTNWREMAFAVTFFSPASMIRIYINILFVFRIQFTSFAFKFFFGFLFRFVAGSFFFILTFCHKIRMIISTLTAPKFRFWNCCMLRQLMLKPRTKKKKTNGIAGGISLDRNVGSWHTLQEREREILNLKLSSGTGFYFWTDQPPLNTHSSTIHPHNK